MGGSWLADNWFEFFQTIGILGSLIVAAYALGRDQKARRVGNLLALNEQYGRIWHEVYARPMLRRVLRSDVDLVKEPISDEEVLFVKMLILHLDAVRQATIVGMFTEIEKLHQDVRSFFSFPIPRAVWEKLKPYQAEALVRFVEDCMEK